MRLSILGISLFERVGRELTGAISTAEIALNSDMISTKNNAHLIK